MAALALDHESYRTTYSGTQSSSYICYNTVILHETESTFTCMHHFHFSLCACIQKCFLLLCLQ